MAASFFPAAVPGTARNAASVMAAGCGEQRPPAYFGAGISRLVVVKCNEDMSHVQSPNVVL